MHCVTFSEGCLVQPGNHWNTLFLAPWILLQGKPSIWQHKASEYSSLLAVFAIICLGGKPLRQAPLSPALALRPPRQYTPRRPILLDMLTSGSQMARLFCMQRIRFFAYTCPSCLVTPLSSATCSLFLARPRQHTISRPTISMKVAPW